MKPIKSLSEELIEFGEANCLWENFENTADGHLKFAIKRPCLIEGENEYCEYDFYMRVGLHMNRLMQVIMACGHFIKFRKEDRWNIVMYPRIVTLDPTKPMDSLYRIINMITPYGICAEHWRPDCNMQFNVYNPGIAGSQVSPADIHQGPTQGPTYFPAYFPTTTSTYTSNNTTISSQSQSSIK